MSVHCALCTVHTMLCIIAGVNLLPSLLHSSSKQEPVSISTIN